MVLAALYGTLLHAWSGQEDLCIGANAANRGQIEAERLVGFFVNQIVLRVRPRRRDTFRELLRQVRHVVTEAYAHQDLPFEKLVEALGRDAGRGDGPLFQAKLEHKEADDAPPLRIPGVQLTELELQVVPLRSDLLLTAVSSAEGVACALGYDTGRVAAATARQMVLDLSRLAEVAAGDPDVRLDALVEDLSRERDRRRAGEREELERLRGTRLTSTRRRSVPL
jgi:non-ribosomal peptide synthetase component F